MKKRKYTGYKREVKAEFTMKIRYVIINSDTGEMI